MKRGGVEEGNRAEREAGATEEATMTIITTEIAMVGLMRLGIGVVGMGR